MKSPLASLGSSIKFEFETKERLLAYVAENNSQKKVARPERFELPTLWFEARCSIQLSYGRIRVINSLRCPLPVFQGAFGGNYIRHSC
jgi:hypothetical protein